MIIIYDVFENKIKLIRTDPKKPETNFYLERKFDYTFVTFSSRLKATGEFLNEQEIVDKLKQEKSNTLILTDDTIGYGYFDLPGKLAKNRLQDAFDTKFRMAFPNYSEYYSDSFELGKDENTVYYFYEFAKRDSVDLIVNVFKDHGIKINNINEYAYLFTDQEANASKFPIATLIVGEFEIELIITRANKVLSVNQFGYGSNVILNGKRYLNSGYNYKNNEALSFAGFMKNHIQSAEAVTDANIMATDSTKGLNIPLPKEFRLLKDEQLEQYVIRSNFKKFFARIFDILDFYSHSPWYFPMSDVRVIGDMDVITGLVEVSDGQNQIHFVDINSKAKEMIEKGVGHNSLFNKVAKVKERKKIDWKKFLSMEIGKKKKD